MARRTKEIQIIEDNRDKGRIFVITEMPALDTEQWSMKALNAIMRNAHPDEIKSLLPLFYSYLNDLNKAKSEQEQIEQIQHGASRDDLVVASATEALAINFASMFFQLPYNELREIADPLLECCASVTDPSRKIPADPIMNNINLYCEEATTIYTLKREAFLLHTDFFITAAIQNIHRLAAQQPQQKQ